MLIITSFVVVMWEYSHSVEADVSKSVVWKLYSDVSTWPGWDKGIERISLDGEFKEGTVGMIKPKGQDELPYRLTEVSAKSAFSDEMEILSAEVTIRFEHTLEDLEHGRIKITHHVVIFGPNADSLGPQIGPGITGDIPENMESLVKLAQRGQSAQNS